MESLPQFREKSLDEQTLARLQAQVSDTELASRAQTLTQNGPLLTIENLQVGYPVRGVFGKTRRYVMAVNDVSFQIQKGETLGLVGESGCGKSTLARALLRLVPSLGGKIWFEGQDVLHLAPRQLRQLRRDMQIVFQDPFSSLDPRMSVGAAIAEPLRIHGVIKSKRNQQERVAYLLERVGLPTDCMNRYPHEFSGGGFKPSQYNKLFLRSSTNVWSGVIKSLETAEEQPRWSRRTPLARRRRTRRRSRLSSIISPQVPSGGGHKVCLSWLRLS
jgi:peptide/nickel transport system ATP-binding protein